MYLHSVNCIAKPAIECRNGSPNSPKEMEEDDEMVDMTAEMAALGLPSTFIARLDPSPSTKKKKSKRKPSSAHKHDSSTEGAELGSADENIPLPSFCIRSVRLYTSTQDPGLEGEGCEALDCSISAQQEAPSTVCDAESVPLSHIERTEEHTQAEMLCSGLEESHVPEREEDVRWEAVWDEEYQCYYYSNSQTWESTWNPPPGFENYAANSSVVVSVVVVDENPNSFAASQENALGVGCEEEVTPEGERVRDSGSSVCSVRGPVEQLDGDNEESRLLSLEKVEAMSKSEEELKRGEGETVDVQEEGGPLQGIELPPTSANSHIRFRDSDESNTSSSEGEDAGVDWEEVREEMPPQFVKEDAVVGEENDGYEACSPSSQHWISSIHARVRQHITASKMGIKKRRLKGLPEFAQSDGVQLPGIVEMMSKKLIKYWIQRYSLFTRFDEGVKLDEEGWFSVTPEIIAKHQASRCVTSGLVIDAFTGVGGNAIQFAVKSHQVIAIDIDPMRVQYARHNAAVYGVADKIEFIVGDFFQLAPFLKADLVFLSPPWGGPEYLKQEVYDLHTMLKPKDGCTLFKAAQSIAPNIALFVPRNVDLNQLQELSWLTSPPLPCEVEKNYVNDKLKAITAYYGEIASQDL